MLRGQNGNNGVELNANRRSIDPMTDSSVKSLVPSKIFFQEENLTNLLFIYI